MARRLPISPWRNARQTVVSGLLFIAAGTLNLAGGEPRHGLPLAFWAFSAISCCFGTLVVIRGLRLNVRKPPNAAAILNLRLPPPPRTRPERIWHGLNQAWAAVLLSLALVAIVDTFESRPFPSWIVVAFPVIAFGGLAPLALFRPKQPRGDERLEPSN